MGLKINREDSATGVGFWRSGVFDANDILGQISEGFESSLLDDYPEYVYDENVYKVTSAIEKV